MQRLIRVRRTILHHHCLACTVVENPKLGILPLCRHKLQPVILGEAEIEKSLDDIECANLLHLVEQPDANRLSNLLWRAELVLRQRKKHHCEIPVKFLAGILYGQVGR